MKLAAWGQQEQAAFMNGSPLEFILHAEETPQAGKDVEVRFWNAKGTISVEKGVVTHSEPGLIKIERCE